MPPIVLFHLAAVFCLTVLQWNMVSQNVWLGVLGIPVLAMWGWLGRNLSRDAPARERYYDLIALGMATVSSYGPMVATLCNKKLLPG